ncbi:thiamine diphosphokinase [Limimaricola sp.]|uniref:thiamine diphosphokinase n=1 Tax=Limimaricola sp. TaxID=2211665 RepID=UPI00341F63B0
MEPVLLVGGAGVDSSALRELAVPGRKVVAADAGADAVLAAGLSPEAVIGDLDSISTKAADQLSDRLHRVEEQVTTDFDKALRHVAAPLVIAAGFTGGRIDHELAVLHGLVCHPDRPCVVVGAETLVFLAPPSLELSLPEGSAFSLFPFGAVMAASEGLRWPTDGLAMAPDRAIGTSNAVCGPVRLRPDAPCLLVILPRSALPVVVAAMPVAARWPARGE